MKRNRSRHVSSKPIASYEQLENRNLLAVNIQLVDAFLVDGNFDRITAPVHGEKIAVQAVWNTTDLPANTSYNIGFVVDGVELRSSTVTSGSGLVSGNDYGWIRTGWYSSGNLQNVTVIADIAGSVMEADETDNTMTFTFQSTAPVDLPQKLIWPMDGDPYSEVTVWNYNDIDPTPGVGDYDGEQVSYNGHNAFDAGPVSFQEMDAGVNLYAAADGVVTYVHDGEFDRHNAQASNAVGNGVIVDHGAGYRTIYWHFRKDSIRVKVGDTVSQGDTLGYMGSSGFSSALHVHFGLERYGRAIEPMFDEASYFHDPFGNVFDNPYVTESVITNHLTSDYFHEGSSRIETYGQVPDQRVTVQALYSGLKTGDQIELTWHRPDGSLYSTGTHTQPANYSISNWYFSRILPNIPDIGTWRVEIKINDVVLKQEFFEVTADGAPEIRIEDDQDLLIVDDRYTPMDFGIASFGGFAPRQSYSIINHGTDDLTLSNIRVPEQFEIIAAPAATVAPGGSETLTVALKTNVAGNHAGEIRISTNDSDEPIYNFSVEGYVAGGGGDHLILGVSERRSNEGTSLVANVRRPGNTIGDLTVTLSSGDASEVSMPASVTIPDGEGYVSFFIQTLADSSVDGPQIAGLSATATGYSTATNTLEVLDVDADGPSNSVIEFDDATGQRSVIRSINVDFDIPVTADAGAFELRNASGDLVDVAFTMSVGSTRATLTFSGTSVDASGSLEDGNYELKVIGSRVRDFAGNQLAGGTDSIDNFFRLFGDTTGNGSVNVFDLLDFRNAYNSSAADVEFNQAVDFNGDGLVNVFDLLAFRNRYGTSA